jgi:prolyl oligopeptidase
MPTCRVKRSWRAAILGAVVPVLAIAAMAEQPPAKPEGQAAKPAGRVERPAAGPPATRRQEVVDTIHGVAVADPYRWLEESDNAEVQSWLGAQNAWTRQALDARPGREALRRRLADLLAIGSLGEPIGRGGRYFHTRRDGADQNQPILYVRDGVAGEDRALLDPNRLSADGTTTIDWWYPSEDGRLVAYGLSQGGDEKSTLRILEVGTGKILPDAIPHTRYASVGWLPDGSGFYYTRYPAPGSVPAGQENYNRHVFLHRLGADPARDPKIFGEGRRPEDMISVALDPAGRFLLVTVFEGWARSDLYVKDLRDPGSRFVPIAEKTDAIFQGEVVGETLYLLTNWEAPRYRLFAVDLKDPRREAWRLLIPESDVVLNQVAVAGDRLVAHVLKDAASRVVLHALDGRKVGDIELPALGTVWGLSARHDAPEAFIGFSSFTVPPTVYRIDTAKGAMTRWRGVQTDVDLSGFEVRQVFFPSKDGTRIPMFLVHRKGLKPSGDTPAYLYGYGGFNVNETPEFAREMVLWIERGGIYALAVLRGGGEYGEAWHRAGMRDKKQNVFDDFTAAARWLIDNKYTRADRLVIGGGSNGGLLVGAALTQRPDLFRAVVCEVPLLDMVRYHRYQIARLWIPEYGSSETPEEFRWLHAYSPYHHVKDGVRYPAVLLRTAEGDSRVDPMHARKMAARLQAATSSGLPVLLRTEVKAGHGAGKPLSKRIDEAVDQWAFVFWQLGLDQPGSDRPEAAK